MMGVLDTITNRRAYLERKVEAHRSAILLHESELRAERAEMIVIVGRLAELDFVVAAYAAETPNAEAGEGSSGVSATPQAPEAEIASVGTGEALSGIVPKKPRDGRRLRPSDTNRDIRGMVLEYVEHYSGGSLDQDQIWRLLGVSPRAVASAVAYWQAKGRLTVDGGVVRLIELHSPIKAVRESEATIGTAAMYGLGVLAGAERVDVAEDGITYGIGGLIAFLQVEPDSTMAEINAAGIPAAEVYRAENDGIVVVKAHGLYALSATPRRSAAE